MPKRSYLLLLLVVCAALLPAGCRSATIEDAFRRHYPDKSVELLFTDTVGDRVLAFFKSPRPDGTEGIGLAVFAGGRGRGWTLTQAGTFYDPGSLAVDMAEIDLGNEGKKDVVFGYTDDPRIARIETVDRDGSAVEAKLVKTDWKIVWFAIGDIGTLHVTAWTAQGDLVAEVPKSSEPEAKEEAGAVSGAS